ncbi:ArsR/SmtB family transcription factor [Alloiococcus sp. CFN-8]|uniref:ArsR/SmtB family transcription factor n=1 Tax=Alloiococcus sp. CFN-8 TaxID=3416081 RepID=UPI003CEB69C7
MLCSVSKALSSPDRIRILKLLYYNSYNIGEIAEKLNIPASTAALHIRILEGANLINTEQQPGFRGSMKLCSRKNDLVTIRLNGMSTEVDEISTVSMPIGAYTDCQITPTCGLVDSNGHIGYEDRPSDFYLPERVNAQLLWSSSGYVEYRFPYTLDPSTNLKQLLLSFEICSEAPNFREGWKSDISIWINGKLCGSWRCPGDFGARRGRLNPSWWENGCTQYGLLTTIAVTEKNTLINNKESSTLSLSDLSIGTKDFITVRIGNMEDAKYIGGFNLFGKNFGDYEQDINMSFIY